MLYGFRILGAYFATAIICHPSCLFSWSCSYHFLQHCYNLYNFPRVEIPWHVTLLLLPSIQFNLLLFRSVTPLPFGSSLPFSSLYNLICGSFAQYSSTLFFFTVFLSFSFNLFHFAFHAQSIRSASILTLPSSNFIFTPTSSIVFIVSSTIEFFSLVFCLLHAVLIHLFSEQAM